MLSHIQAIILAAGRSQRFKTNKNKLIEPICGQSMILYQTKLLQSIGIPITVVIGHYKEKIKSVIVTEHGDSITFAEQHEQKGTGDALAASSLFWEKDNILIMNGDVPLITKDIIQELYTVHTNDNAAISFISSHDNNPYNSYGRVLKQNDRITIVEARDLVLQPDDCCINAGIYIMKRSFLQKYISTLSCNNKNSEYYITDLVNIASSHNLPIRTITAPFDTVRGINTLEELWAAEQVKRSELIKYWMHNGVRFTIAQNIHIDLGVTIGSGSLIGSGVQLTGKTVIGNDCTIGAFSLLNNTTLADHVTIAPHSVIDDSILDTGVKVGPFAYLRNSNHIAHNAIIGSFVELKHTTIGEGSKAKHLSYLGDTTVGNNVNIGGGTITANHDGIKKNRTIIKDDAYVGAGNTLIAPLIIGKGAYTAAGSTLTETVPSFALAIARSRQINKDGYAKKLRPHLHEPVKTKEKEQENFVAAHKIFQSTTKHE
jgi:bifunctional UDP-N-acetylglucosamine pyrophosphorylase/glucosamine-1-phosphate N-acetyltransferase